MIAIRKQGGTGPPRTAERYCSQIKNRKKKRGYRNKLGKAKGRFSSSTEGRGKVERADSTRGKKRGGREKKLVCQGPKERAGAEITPASPQKTGHARKKGRDRRSNQGIAAWFANILLSKEEKRLL